jgi:CRP-like cAMP-binding protein
MTDRPTALDETLIRTSPRALPHLSEFADNGGARCETAEALTPCQLFALSREAFLAALPQSPGLLSTVAKILIRYN